MRRTLRSVTSLTATIVTGLTFGAPPTVVQCTPADRAVEVDPATSAIRIIFDQPMNPRGHSIVGGGLLFPTINGTIGWADDRTLDVPVVLKPGWCYRLSVNSARFQNCRGASGEPATPYPLRFWTAGEPEATYRVSRESIQQSIDQLREAIDARYSYRDLRRVDWPARFAELDPRLKSARSTAQLADAMADLLSIARDPHITVRIGEELVLGTHESTVTPNINGNLLASVVPNWSRLSETVHVGTFEDKIGFVIVTAWSGDVESGIRKVRAMLQDPSWSNGVIIDVRANGGGDELLARQLAACFVDKPAVYSRNRYRDASAADGFGPMLDRVLEPAHKSLRYEGPVAVLIGPAVMSSCESFVLMMQQSPRCTLIGQATYGSSGNPRPVTLAGGITVALPSWQDFLPDGVMLEGLGVPPDLEVPTTAADFLRTDPVLEAALKALREPTFDNSDNPGE